MGSVRGSQRENLLQLVLQGVMLGQELQAEAPVAGHRTTDKLHFQLSAPDALVWWWCWTRDLLLEDPGCPAPRPQRVTLEFCSTLAHTFHVSWQETKSHGGQVHQGCMAG